jgi:two-component system KDP operon response regulator KdpE
MADETRHVLFVDDDAEIIEMVEALLEPRGVNVTTAPDGVEALALLESGLRPDIIIADVAMPNMDGFDLFRAVRDNDTWKDIPFVLVTGNDDRANLSRALMLGSDDYLIKPFLPDELLARVESVLRRTYRTRQPLSGLLRAGPDVLINQASHEVFLRGAPVTLRPAEYTLLVLLAERAGEIVSARTIAEALGMSERDRYRERVKWHVWKLRQSLEEDPKHPRLIITEPGHGYRLEP